MDHDDFDYCYIAFMVGAFLAMFLLPFLGFLR